MLQYGSLLKVMVFTGLRLAEAIGLTWDCVDFEKRRLTINKQLQKRPLAEGGFTSTPLKNDKTRIIASAPFVLELLKRWRQVQATVYIHFKKLATEIDAPNARVHDRRHSYAVLSLQNGDDIKTVQGNLSHATAAFTPGRIWPRFRTHEGEQRQSDAPLY